MRPETAMRAGRVARRMRPAGFVAALVFFLALLPSAQAAAGSVLIVPPTDATAELRVGESETFVFELRNLHPTNLAFVHTAVATPSGWTASVDRASVRLAPDPSGAAANATTTVVVTVRAASPAYERGLAQVRITATTAERTAEDEETISLVPRAPYILGAIANPLPPPLDGAWGVFLLDLAAFAIVGIAVILIQEPLLRRLARQSNRPLADLAVRKLRVPVLLLVSFVGLDYAVGVLPPSTAVDVVVRVLDVGIYVLALYLVYKVFDSILTYYGLKIASKTETKIDDVVVPVLRKVGLVVVVIAGIIVTLRRLDVDLTVFVAGGVVASMVLAFAAQETLSNFFSGVHLLVDRPFVEGDWILLESGEICRVEQIGLRSTRLFHTRKNEVIIMPNNKLSANRVTNIVSPDPHWRVLIDVGVAYSSDVDAVKATLFAIARAHPRLVQEGRLAPEVFFTAFGDSALNFTLRVTLIDIGDRDVVPSEIREAIVREFRAKSIEIPFPQRDLWLRGASKDAVLQVGQARVGNDRA